MSLLPSVIADHPLLSIPYDATTSASAMPAASEKPPPMYNVRPTIASANTGPLSPTDDSDFHDVPLKRAIASAFWSPPAFWKEPAAKTSPVTGSTAIAYTALGPLPRPPPRADHAV